MSWLGLDIGGANIKVADGNGFAVSSAFPLWQRPQQLAEVLRRLIAGAPKADHLAATMSGELADCYVTKADGVQAIGLCHITIGQHGSISTTERWSLRSSRSLSRSRRPRPIGMPWPALPVALCSK